VHSVSTVTGPFYRFLFDELVVNKKTWRWTSNRNTGNVKVDDMDVDEVEGSGVDMEVTW
jgi:hypothetical protein